MNPVDPTRIRRAIAQRLSLRAPQEEALLRLSRIVEIVDAGGNPLAAIRAEYPEVESFERDPVFLLQVSLDCNGKEH